MTMMRTWRKSVMAATATDSGCTFVVDAKFTVDAADALLAELEREDGKADPR